MEKYRCSTMRIIVILCFGFLFLSEGIGCHNPLSSQKSGSVLAASPAFAGSYDSTLADVAEKCIKSVVNISSTRVIKNKEGQHLSPFFHDPFFRHFFDRRFFNGIPRERREKSLGSGVIVSDDGTILTNNHVIENAEEIIVTLSDEREFEAEIVGSDPKSDVAVIKLKEKIRDLQPMHFGDSSRLRLGDVVLAIGNPFGLSHTVTMGIVSAKGRANVGIADYEDFIQTDAAINPGNSGGALINIKGELIGINTALVSRSGGYQGIGFAIPSNMAKSVLDSLMEHGKVVRGWLGVVIQDIHKDLVEAMSLDSQEGILISDVVEDSPAQKAGLERGDIILKINGEKVMSMGSFRNRIATSGADTEVTLTVLRHGKEKTFTLTLDELPEDLRKVGAGETGKGMFGGLTIAPLNPVVRERFKIPSKIQDGVVITGIKPQSPAQRSGLQPGDLILEMNRKKVSSVGTFQKEYKKSKHTILLLVYRQGNTLFLVLRK
ncbi:MAG: DegQ family serine endoprotease [bacterium]